MRGGKRPVVVLSSSDDGGGGGGAKEHVKRRRSPAPAASRKRSRRRAAPSTGRFCSREPRKLEHAKFEVLSAEFADCLSDVSIKAGLKINGGKELWVDKHKPHSSAELAVNKRKIHEIKMCLEDMFKRSKEALGCCSLIINGQAGVGKSTVIHLIASDLGAEVHEWATPTPTLWQEHLHHSSLGVRYMSKLEEFEMFTEKIRKYPLLYPEETEEQRKPSILLIDDLPLPNEKSGFVRLCRCLISLVRSSHVPTVITITDYLRSDSTDSFGRYWEDLRSSLEKVGAYKVTLNPLTINSIKKTLSRICQDEKCELSAELIGQVAQASGGDMRHAIMSLQYYCLRPSTSFHSTMEKMDDLNYGIALPFGRDESLTLFHALGKFLHNKRESADVSVPGTEIFILREQLMRKQLKMDVPEKILSQAHCQSRSMTDFLHENVLDFLNDDAIDDASFVVSYLSDADFILGASFNPARLRMITDRFDLENVSQSVAASVAVRGLLFGNTKPASKWHAIRRPMLWQIEQSSRLSKDQMKLEGSENSSLWNLTCAATEYRPRLKWLGSRISVENHKPESLSECSDSEGAWNEDEIEDW